MGGFNLQSGAALGAGADALQEQLKMMFDQAIKKQAMAQDAKRLQIEQQRADDERAYRTSSMKSLDESRNASAQAAATTKALRIASSLAPGRTVDTPTIDALKAGDMGDLVEHKDATLGSRNLSGAVQATPAAPRILGLASTANPGQAAKDVYTGTADQLQGQEDRKTHAAQLEQARQDRLEATSTARQDRVDAAARSKNDREDLLRVAASLRPAPQAPLMTVQTVDENGNPITKVVKKEAGVEFAKPKGANAQLDNRLASARVVNQVGDSIIQKLSDPKYAATVGPAMGRASKLGDLIGNPPPEFAELAGQIESYALANMGVHGMRSAQGAEAIKKLLDQKHTPESLAATIRGLNDFSTRLVSDSAPKAKGADPLGIR